MREEAEMEEESEMKEESEESEEKEYSEDEMIKCLMEDVSSLDDAKEKLDEYGWELVKKEGSDKKPMDYGSIEKELGMNRMMPKISVVRIAAARKALDKKGKSK